ncbi:MAG: CBS domain-containing protein, partial [Pseudomonadota bacterium]
MLQHPVKVRADDSVEEAMQVIIDNKVSGVCVVNETDHLVGI